MRMLYALLDIILGLRILSRLRWKNIGNFIISLGFMILSDGVPSRGLRMLRPQREVLHWRQRKFIFYKGHLPLNSLDVVYLGAFLPHFQNLENCFYVYWGRPTNVTCQLELISGYFTISPGGWLKKSTIA